MEHKCAMGFPHWRADDCVCALTDEFWSPQGQLCCCWQHRKTLMLPRAIKSLLKPILLCLRHTHIWLGTIVLEKVINLQCPEKFNVLKLRQTQVNSESRWQVPLCKPGFWTAAGQNCCGREPQSCRRQEEGEVERTQPCGWIRQRKAEWQVEGSLWFKLCVTESPQPIRLHKESKSREPEDVSRWTDH